MAQWDYFNPNDRNCQEDCATKRYVESRFDTLVKTLQEKFDEYNTDIQSDWTETKTSKKSYIRNKPTIPAAQIQSDWAETNATSLAFILNKPTLATVATSGNYNDLSNLPTIPVIPTVVSAFNNDANYQSGEQVNTTIADALDDYTPSVGLAPVATSGDYNDLDNLPDIPAEVKLYDGEGNHTDGAMTQKSTTEALEIKADTSALTTVQATLQEDIDAVKATAEAALTPDDVDYTVVSDFALAGNNSTTTIQINSDRVNLKTGTTSAKEIPLPVASSTQAGVMNTATFEAVSENTSNINALMNGAVAVSELVAEPTQEQITAAWKTATGLTELINRASVYDTTNSKVWTYYSNTATWYAAANTTQVEVEQFTNTKAGIVKGSDGDGQVFAEDDGTGSVNGWDALKGRVFTLEGAGYITENDISTLRTATSTNTTDISSLSTSKADKNSLASVATSGSYEDLSNKPTIPTVNNATLTIQENGTSVGTFTANSSTDTTVNITTPVITMTTTDPGEGSTLAANNFIAVYEA